MSMALVLFLSLFFNCLVGLGLVLGNCLVLAICLGLVHGFILGLGCNLELV